MLRSFSLLICAEKNSAVLKSPNHRRKYARNQDKVGLFRNRKVHQILESLPRRQAQALNRCALILRQTAERAVRCRSAAWIKLELQYFDVTR